MMAEPGNEKAVVFALCIFSGCLFGVMFDIFRIIRRRVGEKNGITDVCDGLFWILYTAFFIKWIFKINDGELRWFVFAGIFAGAFLYFLSLSKFIVVLGNFLLKILIAFFCFAVKMFLFPIRLFLKKTKRAWFFASAPLKKFNRRLKGAKRMVSSKLKIRRFCAKKI